MTDADTRPVPGWPGYLASVDGRIVGPSGRELRPWAHWRTGHLRVRLYGPTAPLRAETVNGAVRSRRCSSLYVHVLVALAWLGPPPDSERAFVLHWDGNPANNDVSNLRWGSRAENAADLARHRAAVDADGFDWETGSPAAVAG